MNDLRERVSHLSPAKLNLLLERLRQKEGEAKYRPIPGRADKSIAPLSFSQQRIWFIDQLDAGGYAHNLLMAIHMHGTIDRDMLGKTLNEIVARHEILRASFHATEHGPMQMIADRIDLHVPLIHLAHRDPSALQELADHEVLNPFDLTKAPAFRAALVRMKPDFHVLLITMHHIIGDGWSRRVFAAEFAALYEAFSAGTPSPLPAVAVQYPDYAVWQRETFSGPMLQSQLDYWKKQFDPLPQPLNLPTDFPRPSIQSFRGERIRFTLAPALAEDLRRLAQQESATLFMIVLACFKILLMRYSRQQDIVVGTAIANRGRVETEEVIGFFANTLALRTDLVRCSTVMDALRAVRDTSLGAFANQDLPFELLVSEVSPDRNPARTPLFQAMFLLDNTSLENLNFAGLSAELVDFDAKISPFDISLHMEERRDGFHGGLEYNVDLFEPATMNNMVSAFRQILVNIAGNSLLPISEIPLVSLDEPEENFIEQFRHRDTDLSAADPAHGIVASFLRQAAETPERPAIISGNVSISYVELRDRALAIAHFLRARGVQTGDIVALWGEHTPETVVCIWSILMSGAAYLPIEPSLPLARLEEILADCAPYHLNSPHRVFPDRPEGKALNLPSLTPHIPSNKLPGIAPDDLAYVIYTSGSTGIPRGVQIPHRALFHYARSASKGYNLGSEDRMLQFASFAFDASVEEIFPILISGGTVMFRGDSMPGSVPRFLEDCREAEITVLTLPTAFWRQMLLKVSAEKLPLPETLRLCIIGGERVTPADWDLWKGAVSGHIELKNTYGPTEGTVIATWHSVFDENPEDSPRSEVPLGLPLPECQAFPLDAAFNPVPGGAPGELYLSGPNLARGYNNDPQLTAERFLPHPYAELPGSRMYRTGDIARRRSDGRLEYLGRADALIKLRGYRIEPSEIERTLASHPDVRDAAICLVEQPGLHAGLAAYVELKPSAKFDAGALRTYLAARLPGYMVPSAYALVETLPLTTSGKVNRAALAALPAQKHTQQHVRPRGETEELLAGIWSKILGEEKIGVYDNFFDLGGHSLNALQIAAEVSRQFEVAFDLRQLFRSPTIAAIAELIGERRYTQKGPEIGVAADTTTLSAAALMGRIEQLSPDELTVAIERFLGGNKP